MRSVPRVSTHDQTTTARIRDAAIRRFATQGLDASLRVIAADAGVSAALIVHHFGSADGLRQACHQHVLRTIRDEEGTVATGDTATVMAQLADIEAYAPLVGYTLRMLQAGGAGARDFMEQIAEQTLAYLEAGVAAGTLSPSRDPMGRARLLVGQSVGIMIMDLPEVDGRLDLDTLGEHLRAHSTRWMLPALELYTEPLFRTRDLLDAFLATAQDPAPEKPPAQPADRPTTEETP